MNAEEIIKEETNKRINEFKKQAKERGIPFSSLDETYMRMGIGYGIAIAGLALVNIDTTKIVMED